jgi:hypothetical protein
VWGERAKDQSLSSHERALADDTIRALADAAR